MKDKSMTQKSSLKYTLRVEDIESEPRKLSLEANESDREALVERFALVALDRLTADLSIQHKGKDNGILIKGKIQANLVQRCIVSLADVPEDVEASFELLLVDPDMAARMDEEESYLDPEAPEYDALEGDIIDVGDIVAQTLSITMEPYPRAEDAVAKAPKNPNISINEPELGKPNPFSVLSKLSDKS